MASRAVTMKDIAEHLGVSINTVHKAVAGKPGVSEGTRARVLRYAEECGYQRNMEASALRRKDLTLVACLPALTPGSRFFYGPMWQGCRDFAEEYRAQGIRVVEEAYEEDSFDRTLEALACRAEGGERIDGMVTIPARSALSCALLERIARTGTCLVFASGDEPSVAGRYGAVMADFEVAGALMAEQARNLLSGAGEVLLLAGDAYKDSHYRVARSFHEHVEQDTPGVRVRDVYGYHNLAALRADIERELSAGTIGLVCSVFARASAPLRAALEATGKAGSVPVIANDVFDETVAGLRDGVFTNLVYKDPRRQAYLALRMVGDHLLLGTDPAERVVRSRVSLVFKSTLGYYEP